MVGRVVIVGGYPVDGPGGGNPDVGDVVIGVQVLLATVMVMVFGADGELDVAGVLVSDEDEGGSVHVGELLVVVDDGLGDELVDGPRVVVLAVVMASPPMIVVLSHGSHPYGCWWLVLLLGIVPNGVVVLIWLRHVGSLWYACLLMMVVEYG